MTWAIDTSHTNAAFAVKHLMISTVRGRFGAVAGTIEFDPANPTAATVEATADVTSIDTRDEKRDGHLKSPDFFDVENYPTITLKSKKVDVAGENEFKVTSDLTIHGITKEVVFDVEFLGTANGPWGDHRAAFTAKTSVSRKDFGLNWNVALETGGVLVGDKVTIELEVEALKLAPAAA
ncbi:MAG: YceI family protein [Chloroflexi bacterium]|uniref:YceI family protein n=1 Tax=Candidatus Chlorohelix allophototropha TaxID=3003348 RepID=A0A8T7M7K2_9CHLR|nr:YceI family protein [Chloroflexota bacterium]WJW69826.1 YceI family protein [Chloroflexota bacterium L227-S17]